MSFKVGDVVLYSTWENKLAVGVVTDQGNFSKNLQGYWRVRYWDKTLGKLSFYSVSLAEWELMKIGNVDDWERGDFDD